VTTRGAVRAVDAERAESGSDPRPLATVRRPGVPDWVSRFVIGAVPVAAVALVATRYRQSWYLSDEWRVLQRVLGPNPIRGTFEVYNGHLYSFPILVYRAQVALGINGHALVWICYCITLIACNVLVARLLWAAGVPAVAAVVAGVVITYFGPGAQIATLEFQFGMIGAVALAALAASVALRRRPSIGPALTIAVVLLVATAFDSGGASAGVVLVGVLVALRWRDRWALVAVGPSVVVGAAVLAAARTSPRWPAGFGTEVKWGVHLLLLAAGGLAGGGQIAGGFVFVIAGAVFVPAILSGRMSRDAEHCLAAGMVAALMMTAVISTTRAGIVGNDFVDFNRYVWLVGVFLLVGLLPPAVSVARQVVGRRAAWVGPAAAALLALVFCLNLGPFLSYRRVVEGWQTHTRVFVAQASEQLARGCPHGQPSPNAEPLGFYNTPWITVQFLQQLESRASLDLVSNRRVTVSAPVRNAMCLR